METEDALPISALSHLIYCERRVALVHVVGVWVENQHTAAGQVIHARIDSGESTSKPGLLVLRSVHVRSDRLRLTGIIDMVEVHGEPPSRRFVPVETKRGPRKRWARDDIQLCAQAMALEEMTGVGIPEGAIFHATSQRRRPVLLTAELRRDTERAASRLHAIVAAREVPAPVADGRCPPCSFVEACQPDGVLPPGSLASHLRRAFE